MLCREVGGTFGRRPSLTDVDTSSARSETSAKPSRKPSTEPHKKPPVAKYSTSSKHLTSLTSQIEILEVEPSKKTLTEPAKKTAMASSSKHWTSLASPIEVLEVEDEYEEIEVDEVEEFEVSVARWL